MTAHLTLEAIELLKQMIATPSFSRDETKVADIIFDFLNTKTQNVQRHKNNIWVHSKHFKLGQPVVVLNSHIDTVKPVNGWTYDPFQPTLEEGKLFGLGSNDAGASVVSLMMAFLHLEQQDTLPFNLIYAATAEEEVSGSDGIISIIPLIGDIDLVIVGEPTNMQMAIAERGLMVLECTAKGKAGHAGREEGENAIYNALKDIEWFKTYQFEKTSALLGRVKTTVTQINAGYQHNIIPDTCSFLVDVRTNEHYTNEEVFNHIQKNISCDVKARSFRLNASAISSEHPFVKHAATQGIKLFASPTTSDQCLLKNMPQVKATVKMGPGESLRSHTANEFIIVTEITEAIQTYCTLLQAYKI